MQGKSLNIGSIPLKEWNVADYANQHYANWHNYANHAKNRRWNVR